MLVRLSYDPTMVEARWRGGALNGESKGHVARLISRAGRWFRYYVVGSRAVWSSVWDVVIICGWLYHVAQRSKDLDAGGEPVNQIT